MAKPLVANNAYSTLASTITAASTTISVASGEGDRFPAAATGGDYFYATLIDTSNNLEIIKVTNRSSDTFTVVRAQDGTTAREYSASSRIELRTVAALLEDIRDSAIIADGAITYAKIQDVTADRLLGRTGTSGDVEELSLGTNLSFSGNTLNAGGGSKIIRNWLPTDASFRSSGYATLDTRNTHPVLDFSDSAFENVFFHGIMPDNYETDASIDVSIHYAMTSASSGDCFWAVRIEKMTGLDIDSDSFTATYLNIVDTVPSPAGTVKTATGSLTLADSRLDGLVAGDLFRLEVLRAGSLGTDTASGDAELLMVEMRIQ